MELTQHGFLEEELLSSSSYSNAFNDFFQNGWNFNSFDFENPQIHFPQTPSHFPFSNQQLYTDFLEGFAMPELDSSSYALNPETPQFAPVAAAVVEVEEEERTPSGCKVEMEQMAELGKRSNKAKKIEGQPSKNLMAERRRRKRLNDRLSMLRAIVPKITKMDRTSILGDTIDYVKELIERINNLKEEDVSLNGMFKEGNSNEVVMRNSPKFDVERKDKETRIDICCATRPGLLLSTVNTLEAFGLEIQQCVISSFNDFSMQASCSQQGSAQKTVASSDDIKEALFRNAGYGGKCL